MWTYGQTDGRQLNLMPRTPIDGGHKNMVPIVPDKKFFFHRISNVELSSPCLITKHKVKEESDH